MDAKIKAKWLKALRGGQYSQARNSLTNEQGTAFCCLGVLCNIHAEETGGEWVKKSSGLLWYLNGTYVLPPTVRAWAGLGAKRDPVCNGKKLSTWNDGGTRFNAIADLIEKHL